MPPPNRKNWFYDSIQICAAILDAGADIHAEDEYGWTALDYALASPQAHTSSAPTPASFHPPPTPEPLPSSSSLSIPTSNGSPTVTSPLGVSLTSFSSSPSTSSLSPTLVHSASKSLLTLGHHRDELIPSTCVSQFLIGRGASTHTRDARLDQGLHRAIIGNCEECVRALLDKGESVEASGAKDRSPLHLAASLGAVSILSIQQARNELFNTLTKLQNFS